MVLGVEVVGLKKREEEVGISLKLSIRKAANRTPPNLFHTRLTLKVFYIWSM